MFLFVRKTLSDGEFASLGGEVHAGANAYLLRLHTSWVLSRDLVLLKKKKKAKMSSLWISFAIKVCNVFEALSTHFMH